MIDDDEATARQKLEAAGFTVERKEDSSTRTNEGCVMIQSPVGGQKAAKGSTVTIAVSLPAPTSRIRSKFPALRT